MQKKEKCRNNIALLQLLYIVQGEINIITNFRRGSKKPCIAHIVVHFGPLVGREDEISRRQEHHKSQQGLQRSRNVNKRVRDCGGVRRTHQHRAA
jgi:hypothetical protein